MAHPTRFDSLFDLAKLPWFAVRDGELVVEDQAARGAIDVHTHLALSYLVPDGLDLAEESGESRLYLPRHRGFTLDTYANQNLDADDRRAMNRDLVLGGLFRGRGLRATHTAGTLRREMRGLGVRRSVLLPIDVPGLSRNAEKWLGTFGDEDAFVVFGSVHPLDPWAAKRLARQKAMGARGIKIHPNIQLVAPDHPKMVRLAGLVGDAGLPLFFHCGPVGIETEGGRQRTQVDRYRVAIEANPQTTFILGHTGALQPENAIALAAAYPNVWVELASQGLPVVRRILGEVDPARIMFGTDWPFYHQGMGLAKVLLATDGDDALRRRVLYENAERLLAPARPRPD